MALKFTPSDDAVALAIRCQRGLNTRLIAPTEKPASVPAGLFAFSLLSGRNAMAAAAPAVPDAATMERAGDAIGSKIFRVVGTIARRKGKKQTVAILKAGKFEPAVKAALAERLGLVAKAAESGKVLDQLAAEFSTWADQNAADLAQVGISRRNGKLVLQAEAPAAVPAAAARAVFRQAA